MAATPSAASDRGRPLSTVQLISPDRTEDESRNRQRPSEHFIGKCGVLRSGSGIENAGFDLGTPLAVDSRQTQVYQEFTFCDSNQEQKRSGPAVGESLQISDGNVRRTEELGTPLNVSMVNCKVRTVEERNAHALRKHMETPVRSSWLLDGGSVRRRDDAVWRRRKTDPSGDACTSGNYSYHRDYQEALSSLLWEPYDCRQPESSTLKGGCGDVSVWLHPRVMRRAHLSSSPSPSSSSSTLSVSSYSSSAVHSAMGTSGDGLVWDRDAGDARDSSSSSLRALLLSNSSSKDDNLTTPLPCSNNASERIELRSDPVDVRSTAAGNVTLDPNQQQEQEEEGGGGWARGEDAVADPHTRWCVADPPGALQSPDSCELCWQDCSQCESSAGSMLVSVAGGDPAPAPAPAPSVSVSASASASVSVVSCYRAVPVVVSAVPTISCLNVSHVSVEAGGSAPRGRTFTSTEAQTDDMGVAPATPPNNREQRRRERRERRHQRRANNSNNSPPQHETHWQTLVADPPPAAGGGDRLPDILNSHLPPPYSTLPLGLPPPGHVVHPHLHHPSPPPPVPVAVPVTTAAPGSPPPHHHHHGGMRFPFQITPGERRR
jgi:hypothetical protein